MTAKQLAQWDEQWTNRNYSNEINALAHEIERQIMRAAPDYETLWRHARVEHFIAMQAEEDKDKAAHARHLFAAELQAEKAAKLEPNRVEGLFWSGVTRIEAGRARGGLAAASALKPARKSLEAAAAIDETFHFAGAWRVLGRIQHKAPKLMGGNGAAAVETLRRADAVSPGNSTTLLYLAEALQDLKQESEARAVLERIVVLDDQHGWRWEQERDRRRARLLLASDAGDGASTEPKDDS